MPFLLANAGYDVFLMSMRGTNLSLAYRNLSAVHDTQYWNFDISDLAFGDVRHSLLYVRRLTGAHKVGYVGHSMGSFTITALLCEKPQYVDIVEPVITLCQVSFVGSIYSPVFKPLMESFALKSAIPERHSDNRDNRYRAFPIGASEIRSALGYLCYRPPNEMIHRLCLTASELFGGTAQPNLILNKRFARFNHGPIGNVAAYGSLIAPDFNVTAFRSQSFVLFHGQSNSLGVPADIDSLLDKLTTILHYTTWNHFGPLAGTEAGARVNFPALQVLEEFDKNESVFD
ncbi:Lipase 3, partial [Fragariocoptes setiger]